jgi:hypothetical protein
MLEPERLVTSRPLGVHNMVVSRRAGCVYSEFIACGEHVNVGVDEVVVECDII